MRLTIRWTASGEGELRRLDRNVARLIRQAVLLLAERGQGDVVSLKPPLYGYRLRVSDWRVSFDRDPSTGTIAVLRIKSRDQAYRR